MTTTKKLSKKGRAREYILNDLKVNEITINRDNMRTFVDYLKTTKDLQGVGQLHLITNEGIHQFCCLGIACKVAINDGLKLETIVREHFYGGGLLGKSVRYGDEYASAFLPFAVADWLGVYTTPDLATAQGPMHASFVNDDLKWSFRKIAELFEYTYLGEE